MDDNIRKGLNDRSPDAVVFELAVVFTNPLHSSENGDKASKKEAKNIQCNVSAIDWAPVDGPECAILCFCKALIKKGLFLEDVQGIGSEHFLKVAAPIEVLGQAAETMQMKNPTHMGLDVPFEWDEREAFIPQSEDNTLFSWTERYNCLVFLLHAVVNSTEKDITLTFPGQSREIIWNVGEALLDRLLMEGIAKEVLPLHEDSKRRALLTNWALKWEDFSAQPLEAVYSYFGPKVAIYFAFLGMYTSWLIFPSILGVLLYTTDVGPWEVLVPPAISVVAITWAVVFLQFWKRKNAALLARWNLSPAYDNELGQQKIQRRSSISQRKSYRSSYGFGVTADEKQFYQEKEWAEHFQSFRNNATVIAGILCFQLPFEIAYTHLVYEVKSNVLSFLLTGVYILFIQYFTKIGSKYATNLTKSEHYESKEEEADSLIYKVFGLYFMQSYIGLFYEALFKRDFVMLRQFLFQRLVISQIINNFVENLLPYITYQYNKFTTVQQEKEDKKESGDTSTHHLSAIEQEYLKPEYSASIENDLQDGLFDDFLELALQFGMVTMFASAFPLVFAFALINNLMEIRSDALKLLVMLRRPTPQAACSIGAWLNIFQYLGTIAICTNCALLACLYDQQGKWSIEPGLAAILLMEHVLLLVKFGFSCFVPEEPAWVRAKKTSKRILHEQYSRLLLHNPDIRKKKQAARKSRWRLSEMVGFDATM